MTTETLLVIVIGLLLFYIAFKEHNYNKMIKELMCRLQGEEVEKGTTSTPNQIGGPYMKDLSEISPEQGIASMKKLLNRS